MADEKTVDLNETAYWLALINQSGLKLNKLKPIAQQWHLMEGKSIAQLFNLTGTELCVRFNLTDREAQGILRAADSHQAQLTILRRWQNQGIDLLTLNHPDYPRRLIYTLPPMQQPLLLWARGQTDSLAEPLVTILGKEDPEPETVSFIQTLAGLLESETIGVVSGYGKGLDRLAFEAMLETATGRAVAILPMGLTAFARLTDRLDDSVAAGQALLLSPFAPELDYKDNLAAARNLLVDSLALAVLAPDVQAADQPRLQGILDRGVPVLVGLTDSPENRAMIASGAFLMTDPGEVVELVQQAIIDDSLQVQAAQSPAEEGQPPPIQPQPQAQLEMLNDEDDYALTSEAADPLEAGEALDILSSMGAMPDSLRARLMAMEAQRRDEDDDEGDDAAQA